MRYKGLPGAEGKKREKKEATACETSPALVTISHQPSPVKFIRRGRTLWKEGSNTEPVARLANTGAPALGNASEESLLCGLDRDELEC